MNFELKTLSLAQAAAAPAALLIVLLDKSSTAKTKATGGAIAALIAQAHAAGDMDGAAGKILSTYSVTDVKAAKTTLAGVGEGSARDVHKAVAAAVAGF